MTDFVQISNATGGVDGGKSQNSNYLNNGQELDLENVTTELPVKNCTNLVFIIFQLQLFKLSRDFGRKNFEFIYFKNG